MRIPWNKGKKGLQKAWNKGVTGYKHKEGRVATAETRRILSLAKIGKPSPLKGKKLTDEHRKNLSISHIGKRTGPSHHNWKGGATSINEKIRKSVEYKLWRKAVFERDGYVCIWGGKEHGHNLHADHIKPFAFYPELRFAIDNGRTLCVECHKTTDTYLKNKPRKNV